MFVIKKDIVVTFQMLVFLLAVQEKFLRLARTLISCDNQFSQAVCVIYKDRERNAIFHIILE